MDKKTLMAMSEEERMQYELDSLSDAVKDTAHRIMMLKAMANTHNGINPEDFDKAFKRECEREWEKLKDKTAPELALIGLLEMVVDNSASVEEIFVESEEE